MLNETPHSTFRVASSLSYILNEAGINNVIITQEWKGMYLTNRIYSPTENILPPKTRDDYHLVVEGDITTGAYNVAMVVNHCIQLTPLFRKDSLATLIFTVAPSLKLDQVKEFVGETKYNQLKDQLDELLFSQGK